jgi:hypothetical protein
MARKPRKKSKKMSPIRGLVRKPATQKRRRTYGPRRRKRKVVCSRLPRGLCQKKSVCMWKSGKTRKCIRATPKLKASMNRMSAAARKWNKLSEATKARRNYKVFMKRELRK